MSAEFEEKFWIHIHISIDRLVVSLLQYTLYTCHIRWVLKHYTGCFTTCGHYCRRWFPRSLWSKNSYKHVSDFGRLRSYGHFLVPVHALVWTASYGNSWQVMYSTWWLIVCFASIILLPPDLRNSQPSSSLCCGRWWHFRKTSFKHRSIQIKGNFTKLTLHLYLKCVMYYAGLLFCSVYCQ